MNSFLGQENDRLDCIFRLTRPEAVDSKPTGGTLFPSPSPTKTQGLKPKDQSSLLSLSSPKP